jgi:MFS family permease
MVGEGIINVLGFPWIATVLRGGAPERGWLATAQGVGGIVGGLALRGLRQVAPGRVIGVGGLLFSGLSLALTNIALLPIGAGGRWPLALLLKGLSGAPLVALTVGLDTLLVRSVDDRVCGRVVAAYGAANGGALLVGQTLASVLGDRLGVVPVLSLQGVFYVVAGCAALNLLPLSRNTKPATDHTALPPWDAGPMIASSKEDHDDAAACNVRAAARGPGLPRDGAGARASQPLS